MLMLSGVLASAASARGADTRVLLLRPAEPSPLLSEALVYVQGELGSVQLEPSQAVFQTRQPGAAPVLRPGTYGALVFVEQGGMLVIEAYRPDVPEPITQSLNTRDGRITPQVVAIRAVEALRAAMQQLVRSHPDDATSVPEAVQRFARVQKEEVTRPAPVPSPVAPREPEPSGAPLEVGLWAAPDLRFDPQADHPFFGFGMNVVIGKHWYFAVAHFDSTVTPLEFEEDSGRAEVDRVSASGHLRIRGSLTTNLGAYFEVGGGAALFDIEGFASPDFDTDRQRHTTVIGVAALGMDYWVMRRVAFFTQVNASAALDAPAVGLAGAERRRLERPLLAASLGLALSYR